MKEVVNVCTYPASSCVRCPKPAVEVSSLQASISPVIVIIVPYVEEFGILPHLIIQLAPDGHLAPRLMPSLKVPCVIPGIVRVEATFEAMPVVILDTAADIRRIGQYYSSLSGKAGLTVL